MMPSLMLNGIPAFPFVMTLFSFVFVLLIILLQKVPKVGAWVVAGLMVLVPFAFLFLDASGKFPPDVLAFPFITTLCSFGFVLLIILLQKAPRVGAVVLVTVFVMILIRLLPGFGVSHSPVAHLQTTESSVESIAPIGPTGLTGPVRTVSPIWSEGMENEFEADIYPSRLSAARALGSRMEKAVRTVTGNGRLPERIVLFREEHDHELISAFEEAMRGALEGVPCAVETNLRNLDPNEAAVVLRFVDREGLLPTDEEARSGALEAKAFAGGQPTSIRVQFSEKPWLDDFARYLSERPGSQVIVARSQETCTDENEARQQAIQDACNQLSVVAGQRWTPVPGRPPLTVGSQDLQEGGFILDQFVQSFDGSAGRIWRQAMLIDTSADKLSWLNDRKTAEVHVERVTWARVILSAFGVLIVIVAAYLFLNMATKGYYTWSLRIAGTVLAIAGIISIFLVLR